MSLVPSSSVTLRSRPRAGRVRARAGFTLIEMMVALTIGALVIATVYTIGASAARHFQEQQRISQLQLSVRLALDRVRRDIGRAAFHGPMTTDTLAPEPVTFCGPPPPVIRGLTVTDRSAITAAALGSMSGYSASVSHGDAVDIVGNFRTGDAFVVREWNGNQMQLATNYMSFRRAFSADPTTTTIDTALLAETFPVGTPLWVRIGGGDRIWTSVTGVTATTTGTTATITTLSARPSCPRSVGMEGWAQGGVTVAPLTQVRYEIVNAATPGYLGRPVVPGLAPRNPLVTGTNTVLMRTELNPFTGEVLEGPSPILEYAVHFDVDVFSDVGAAPAGASQIQLFDDANAALRTLNFTGRTRGVRISLAARTPEQDGRLTQAMAPMGDGTPRVFRVFGGARLGAARVRSAYTEVFIPNTIIR